MANDQSLHMRCSVQQGFTLVELLVALLIFAMLTTTGVILLRGSVDAQGAIKGRLEALGDVQRGVSTLDADLGQAVVRISRTQTGTLAPAFFGRDAQQAQPLLQFVRAGWSNPDNQRHPSLQKIEYWWREGRIERIGYPAIDGAAPPDPAILFDKVTGLAIRYRAPTGEWLDLWSPVKPEAMPTLVELTITREREAPLTLRFLVGNGRRQQNRPEDAPTSGGLGNGA